MFCCKYGQLRQIDLAAAMLIHTWYRVVTCCDQRLFRVRLTGDERWRRLTELYIPIRTEYREHWFINMIIKCCLELCSIWYDVLVVASRKIHPTSSARCTAFQKLQKRRYE